MSGLLRNIFFEMDINFKTEYSRLYRIYFKLLGILYDKKIKEYSDYWWGGIYRL